MESNGGEPDQDQGLEAHLDTARTALLDGAQRLRARGEPNAEDLIPTAREIQRLTEALMAELVR